VCVLTIAQLSFIHCTAVASIAAAANFLLFFVSPPFAAMTKPTFRPRPIDVNKKLLIIRSKADLQSVPLPSPHSSLSIRSHFKYHHFHLHRCALSPSLFHAIRSSINRLKTASSVNLSRVATK
jgi:hypothetical protein